MSLRVAIAAGRSKKSFDASHDGSRLKIRRSPVLRERALQQQVVEFLRVALPPEVPWTAFPAGGGGAARGGVLKAMGLAAGWPDIVLVLPPLGALRGIELKAPKGTVSPEQRVQIDKLCAAGAATVVCRSVEEVAAWLAGWGIALRARLLPGGGIAVQKEFRGEIVRGFDREAKKEIAA